MNKLFKYLLIGFLSFSFSSVHAFYACEKTITEVHISNGGGVFISTSEGEKGQMLCNVSSKAGSVIAQACKAMFTSLIIAKETGSKIKLWFANDATSCTKGNWIDLFEVENGELYHLAIISS